MMSTRYIVDKHCQRIEFDENSDYFYEGAPNSKVLTDRARQLILRYLLSVEEGWEEEDFWGAVNWAYKVECVEEELLSKGGAYSNVRPLGLTRSQLKGTIESEEHMSLFPDAKYSLVKLPTDDEDRLYVWGDELFD
jgi:hypothetical protein